MPSLGDLVVSIAADLTKFTEGMTKAEAQARKTADKIEGSMDFAKKAIASLGIGLTAAKLVEFAKHTVDSADELGKMAQKTGIATEELSKLKYNAELSDVSTKSLTVGVKKLSQEMIASGDATGKTAKIMAAMGVDTTKGVTPAMEKIADVFAAMPDGATKTALAVELFGKSGMELIPMLNQGAAGMKKMGEEAEKLGLVLNGETAKAAEMVNDNLKAVKAASQGTALAVLTQLSPAMVRITEAMKQAATESGLLKAVWVAMGGIAAEALGLNDSDAKRVKDKIRDVQSRLEDMGETMSTLKKQQLIEGIFKPLTGVEFQFVALTQQLRGLLALQKALAGGFQDQNDRRMGKGGGAGVGPNKEDELRKLLGSKDGAEKTSINMIAGMEKELEGLKNLSGENKKYNSVLIELAKLKKEGIKVDETRILELAKEIDAQAKLNQANEFATAEHQKDLDFVAAKGEAITNLVNSLEDERIAMEEEVSMLGLSSAARQKAILLRRMEEDLIAAGDNAAAIRDIRMEYEKMIEAVGNGESIKNFQDAVMSSAETVGEITKAFGEGGVAGGINYARNALRSFASEIASLAMKKIYLNIIASATGNAGIASQAASMGNNSMAGNVLSMASNATGIGGAMSAFSGGFMSGMSEVALGSSFVGPSASLAAGATGYGATIGASMAEGYAALMSTLSAIPIWGWIAMAVIAVAAWLGGRGGGPKVGGSAMQAFNSLGEMQQSLAVPGTDNGRFFTPNQADDPLKKLVGATGKGYFETLAHFGGKTDGMSFGLGFDHDPAGTAQSRVSSMVTDSKGNIVYKAMDVQMDDKEVPAALQLESQRMILAAMQKSDLPTAIAGIFNMVDVKTASAETIAQIFDLANAFQGLETMLADFNAGDIITSASRSMQQVLADQGQAVIDLANKTSMSTDSLNTLAQATASLRQQAAQLVMTFENAKKALSDMFGSTARTIQMSGLTGQGKYDFLQSESASLYTQALGSSDINDIQQLAQKINSDINEAFSMLTPEQQAAKKQEYLDKLAAVNTALQARITALEKDAVDKVNTQLQDIKDIAEKLAKDNAEAARKQIDAANTQLDAANINAGGVRVTVQDNRVGVTNDGD